LQPAVEVRAPRDGDAEALAAGMRAQDIAELEAVGRPDLVAVVRESIAVSTWCWTVTVDGELAAILGVTRHGTVLAPIGVPWMLGTELVRQHRRCLARLTPQYIDQMLQVAPHLLNYVHARNTVAVRWLKRTGFRLHPARPHGPFGEPFHLFEMRAHV
jgi:hypothetical protein